MARLLLTDVEWELIADAFPPSAATGRPRCDPRRVLDEIFWVLRTGSPWRVLPGEFGSWKTAWRMFDRWTSDGTLDESLRRRRGAFATAGAIDQQLWCLDGTTVRAARCAAGGGKKGPREARRPRVRPFARGLLDENCTSCAMGTDCRCTST